MSVIIIAEAGVNHNGEINKAKELIDAASYAGADIVKFQTYQTDNVIIKSTPLANYQKKGVGKNETQYKMLKRLELSYKDTSELFSYCQRKNIEFVSTGFDIESLSFLIKIGMKKIKVPSGEITNLPLLRYAGKSNKNIILSSGMASLNELNSAINVLVSSGTKLKNIIALHCTSNYPTHFNDVNLNAMNTIKNKLNVEVGYSDHTIGLEVPLAAVALGAKVIEKHYTLDKSLEGPDHFCSLNPEELKEMISSIRNVENSLGDGIKNPKPSEVNNKNLIRKSIVAKNNIEKNELLSENNLTCKRPGIGISPMNWDSVVGTKAIKKFLADDLIEI